MAKVRPNTYKKARYSIRNVSKKDLLKTFKEFEKLSHEKMRRRGPTMSLQTANFTYNTACKVYDDS